MIEETDINALAEGFDSCAKMLNAVGDETRQYLILEMLKLGDHGGLRVGEITEKTNLSRPAISHHLRILKDAGIIKMRKEGTKHYYYFDPEIEAIERQIATLQLALRISKALPDRSKENKGG